MREPKEYGCFEQTRKMFASVTGIHEAGCHDYETWMQIEPEYRAAALYCIFYDVIILARKKAYSATVDDDTAVSEVCKLLFTETHRIEEDPARYSSRYIYTSVRRALLRLITKGSKWYAENRITTKDEEDIDNPDPMFNIPADCETDDFIESERFRDLWNSLSDAQRDLIIRIMNREKEIPFLAGHGKR